MARQVLVRGRAPRPIPISVNIAAVLAPKTSGKPPVPVHPWPPRLSEPQDGVIVYRVENTLCTWIDGVWVAVSWDDWSEMYANARPSLINHQWTVLPYLLPLQGKYATMGLSQTITDAEVVRAFSCAGTLLKFMSHG